MGANKKRMNRPRSLPRTILVFVLCSVAGCGNKDRAEPTVTAADRLEQVRALIQKKDAAGALALIEKAFPNDASPAIAEERARAHEVALAACTTAPCRFAEVSSANAAHGTPERAKQVATHRPHVVEALAIERVVERAVIPRLQQVRQLADDATLTINGAPSDADLQSRAKAALEFARVEQSKVPLLKMELATAEALLGPSKMSGKRVPSFSLDGVTAFLALDATGKCVGIFAVGSSSTNRALKSSTWPADRLLSQAIGRNASIRPPSAGSSTSRWTEGNVPVVVRWRNGDVMELRIGDAAPY